MDWDTELTEAGREITEEEADWMVVLIGSGRGPWGKAKTEAVARALLFPGRGPPVARGARFVVKMFMAQISWAEGEYARRFCRSI